MSRSWRGEDAILRSIDGTEIAHPLTDVEASGRGELDRFYARARAANPRAARIGSSKLKELVVTDSIQATDAVKKTANIRMLSIADLISEAIQRTAHEESVSSLFD